MPATRSYQTPGVYVAELSSFPPSVVGVQTAIPAFVGYTQMAEISGKPVPFKPVPISSLAAYEQVFGGANKAVYDIKAVSDPDTEPYDFRVLDSDTGTYKYYSLSTEDRTYNLYDSMRLFYANGGGNCYVVSAGLYTDPDTGNANAVTAANLVKGLAAVQEQVGPTMLVVPDATLLPPDTGDEAEPWDSAEFQEVVRAMLLQCETLQDRVAILDVYGTESLTTPATDPTMLDSIIARFREDVGSAGLSYGMAYFPYLHTTVVPLSGVNYTNLNIDDSTDKSDGVLQQILTWQATDLYGDSSRGDQVRADIAKISPNNTADEVKTLNHNLTASLPLLVEIERMVVANESVLPPSAAMAGVMTYVDANRGVWNAPANVSLSGVARPSFPLNGEQQADLNVPVDGKAVDALREFPGRGTVVWGARTLDGNSNDFRYIQVRRTLIYVEQSIKNALNPFVFAPNTGQTWTSVVSMVSSFLQTLWSQGGLMGATASEAFSVECGLGSTMTGQDVLEGYMIVQVTLQLIRPAEFIELTFKQKMEGVG